MGIKETPTNFRVYYKDMITSYTQKKEETEAIRKDLIEEAETLYNSIKANIDNYKSNFNLDLTDYKEFVENTYIDGLFYKVAKGAFINKRNNYELVSDLFDLFNYAKYKKEINELDKLITKYDKCLSLKLGEYSELLRFYYTQVHKQLILEGEGYAFSHSIGWICINRCLLKKVKPHIDFNETRKRKEQLKAEGKRIYNKTEAEWCANAGIEYKAEDVRVFQSIDYCYEIPLISSKLPNGTKLRLEITDYRHSSLRGKTYDDIIKLCDNKTENICEMPIDLKSKLNICDKVDEVLFVKFIRNESQQPITTPKANRKNR